MNPNEGPDSDDIDVYVSPRKYGGHTPGAKETRERVMKEGQVAAELERGASISALRSVTTPPLPPSPKSVSDTSDEDIAIDIDNIKYTIDRIEESRESASTHKNIKRNNSIAMGLLAINYVLVVLGFLLLCLSTWVALAHRNGGIASYIFVKGLLLKAPLALAGGMFVGSVLAIFNGFFLGARHVAPSIVEGLQVRERRIAFTWHQLLSSMTILCLTLVLVSAFLPLNRLGEGEVDAKVWLQMALSHPDRVCAFQVQNSCSGVQGDGCLFDSATENRACPGHFCSGLCNITNAIMRNPDCLACDAFPNDRLLTDCRLMEARRDTSQNCRQLLRRDLRTYLLIIVVSSGIGIGWMTVVSLMSCLSPLLSMN